MTDRAPDYANICTAPTIASTILALSSIFGFKYADDCLAAQLPRGMSLLLNFKYADDCLRRHAATMVIVLSL